MESALPAGMSTMAIVLGMESDVLSTLCKQASHLGVVEIANYNCPGQLVIGGELDAVAEVSELAISKGARRVLPLAVSGAFHTSLLKEAGTKLRQELDKVDLKDLKIPVIFNKTAKYQHEPLVDLLAAQVYSSVRFEDSIRLMLKEGVNTFIEIGPGKTLSGFVKKIDKKAIIYQVEDVVGINKLVEKLEALIKTTVDKLGTVDVLVNNAGITRDNLILRMSDEDFDKVIDVNLKGVFYLTRAVSKLMFKKRSGKIVNITSISGVTGNVGQANYAASKAGVIGLTKTVAKELAPRGIQVNAVAPGYIQTDMTDVLDTDLKAKNQEEVPLKKLGIPEDIANMVGFLVSDNANYITGQVFHVDGGWIM